MKTNTSLYFIVILLFLLCFLFLAVNYHLKLIFFPFQLEYREGATLLISNSFLSRNLPYSIQSMPNLIDMYGFVYPFVGSLFIKQFGVGLITLRVLSGVVIFITTIYFFYTNFKKNKSILFLLSISIIFYTINLFSVIPLARADSLGYLFFILAIYVPFDLNFTNKSIVISLIMSVLAFYTKSYFVIGFPFLMIYIFLYSSMKKSIFFSVLFFVVITASLFFIHFFFNFYFLSVFSATLYATNFEISHLFEQLSFYFIDLFYPISLFLVIYFIVKIIKKRYFITSFVDKLPNNLNYILNIKDLNRGLFSNLFNLDYNLFIFLAGLALIFLKLGGHTGQFGVYLIQFLTFPLLSFVIVKFQNLKFNIHICIFVSILLYNSVDVIVFSTPKEKFFYSQLLKVERVISKEFDVLSTPIFASSLIKNNQYVYLSGLTENSFYVDNFRENYHLPQLLAKVKDKISLRKINKCVLLNTKYTDNIRHKIIDKKFSLIISDTSSNDDWAINDSLLNIYYHKIDSVNVYLVANYHHNKVFLYKPNK